MSLFASSGKSRRNFRPKVVHSISDSDTEDTDLTTPATGECSDSGHVRPGKVYCGANPVGTGVATFGRYTTHCMEHMLPVFQRVTSLQFLCV